MNEKIEEILDNFDFESVHKIMSYMNYTWLNSGVPSIKDMKEAAAELLNRIKNMKEKGHNRGSCECGRFKASFFIEEAEIEHVKLEFIPIDYDAYIS